MFRLRLLTIVFAILILPLNLHAKDMIFACEKLYGADQFWSRGNPFFVEGRKFSKVKVTKGWFKKEVFRMEVKKPGKYISSKVMEADDDYILFSDGWGIHKSETSQCSIGFKTTCGELTKFFMLVSEAVKPSSAVEWQLLTQKNCCYEGQNTQKGKSIESGRCYLMQEPIPFEK